MNVGGCPAYDVRYLADDSTRTASLRLSRQWSAFGVVSVEVPSGMNRISCCARVSTFCRVCPHPPFLLPCSSVLNVLPPELHRLPVLQLPWALQGFISSFHCSKMRRIFAHGTLTSSSSNLNFLPSCSPGSYSRSYWCTRCTVAKTVRLIYPSARSTTFVHFHRKIPIRLLQPTVAR